MADPTTRDGFWGIFDKLQELGIYDESPGDLYGPDLADFYDRMVGEYIGDIPLFERHLPPGGRVLDLACGAGRIGIPLAQRGFLVDGLELSEDMLALALEKAAEETPEVRDRLTFVQGDMSDFSLPHRYDLILVGVTSISLLLTERARRGLFQSVRRHLAPGAFFIFNILDLEGDRWKEWDNYFDVWSVEDDVGVDFAIVGQRFFPEERRFCFNVFREIVSWGGETRRVIGTSTKAWLGRDQLRGELSRSRLSVVEEFTQDKESFFIVQSEEE